MRRVVVEIRTFAVLQYEDGYDSDDHITFHLNDSTHCVSNEFTRIAAISEGVDRPCGCRFTDFRIVREATQSDLDGETAFNLIREEQLNRVK